MSKRQSHTKVLSAAEAGRMLGIRLLSDEAER
jgi:hypothetical protein